MALVIVHVGRAHGPRGGIDPSFSIKGRGAVPEEIWSRIQTVCSITASFRFLTLRMKSFFHRILCDACPICCLIPMKVAAAMHHFHPTCGVQFPALSKWKANLLQYCRFRWRQRVRRECARQHVEPFSSIFFLKKTKFHSGNTTC